MENPPPPTIPRVPVKAKPERRINSGRVRRPEPPPAEPGDPAPEALKLAPHEDAEVGGVAVPGEMPNPSMPFEPWAESSQPDLLTSPDIVAVTRKVDT